MNIYLSILMEALENWNGEEEHNFEVIFPKENEKKMKNNQGDTIRLFNLLNKLKEQMNPDDIKNIIEFIEHEEYGLAYETICTQLYEHRIKISHEIYNEISFLGQLIEIQPSVWLPLKELIKIK